MQDHDWDDLRYFLALHRAGSLAAAARWLGANETTVGRRIRRLEQNLAAPLFLRTPAARYVLSEIGQRALAHAEAAERANIALGEEIGKSTAALRGRVRISSVPILINRVLVPHLRRLREAHPELVVELVPDPRNADLGQREADLTLRFSRPTSGGLSTRAQKLGELRFAVYCAAAQSDAEAARDWIGYDDAHADLPQARWLRSVMRDAGGTLRVSDAETALEAAARGLGRTLLPRIVADADPRLRIIGHGTAPAPPARQVWLLSHVDQGGRASLDAAKHWLAALPWDQGRC